VTKSPASPRAKSAAAADQASVFLRNMMRLQQGLLRRLVPMLEQDHDIDFRLYFILRHIGDGAVHPGAISKITHLPNSVITRHIDQLVAKGLLKRSLDPEDSRRIKLTLTAAGARVAREAHRTICALVGKPLEKLPAGERNAFLQVFAQLADDLAP
jgi:DNA-binding MarR family transcriptional regulator